MVAAGFWRVTRPAAGRTVDDGPFSLRCHSKGLTWGERRHPGTIAA